MAGKFLCAYHNWIPALEALSDAEVGRLFRCALKYSASNEETDLTGNERYAWAIIRPQIDKDNNKHEAKIKNLQKAGKISAEKRQQMLTNVDICQQMSTDVNDRIRSRKEKQEEEREEERKKERSKEKKIEEEREEDTQKKRDVLRFAPPTVDEVRSYCRERGNQVDAQRFIDYYTSNGWKVGRNPMKDWRAAVRTWERSGAGSSQKPEKITNNPFMQMLIDRGEL